MRLVDCWNQESPSSNHRAQSLDQEMAHSIVGIHDGDGGQLVVPEVDSGQLLVHKRRSWLPLLLLFFFVQQAQTPTFTST